MKAEQKEFERHEFMHLEIAHKGQGKKERNDKALGSEWTENAMYEYIILTVLQFFFFFYFFPSNDVLFGNMRA